MFVTAFIFLGALSCFFRGVLMVCGEVDIGGCYVSIDFFFLGVWGVLGWGVNF